MSTHAKRGESTEPNLYLLKKQETTRTKYGAQRKILITPTDNCLCPTNPASIPILRSV